MSLQHRDVVTSGASAQPLLAVIVECAPLAIVVVNADGCITFINHGTEILFGHDREELIGQPVEILVPATARNSHRRLRSSFFAQASARHMGAGRELNALRKDGTQVPVEVLLKPLETDAGLCVLGIVIDIAERKRLEQRFEIAVEASPVAMMLSDQDGRIIHVNREAERLYGYDRKELAGQPVELLVPERFRAQDQERRERFFAKPIARRMGGAGHEFCGLRKDASEFPIEIALNPVPAEDGTSILITVVDITERKHLENLVQRSRDELERKVEERTAELALANREKEALLQDLEIKRQEFERLSREDALTGLANRRDFDRRLDDEIRYSERHGTPLALAMFDLDHFKRANDRFGHAIGDAVLRETGSLMRRECRAIDIIARYGGEEFAIVFPHTNLQHALVVCERIRRAFECFEWNSLAPGLRVTISAGISTWSAGARAIDVLEAADANLYEAKRGGRNCVVPRISDEAATAALGER